MQGGGKSPYDPGQTFRGLGEEETARQHAKTQTTQEGDFEGRTDLYTRYLPIMYTWWNGHLRNPDTMQNYLFANQYILSEKI